MKSASITGDTHSSDKVLIFLITNHNSMIPLIHNLKGKKVVIFGGGEVGFRKASFFYPEAEVYIVSRNFCKKIKSINVILIEKDLNAASDSSLREIISGCRVVVAATSDRELNNRIGNISKEAGILFNNADGDEGDIMIPSVISGENYLIAITTGGQSPGMSKYLRKFLETECPYIDDMIQIQNELRILLKKTEPVQKRRNDILQAVMYDKEVWINLEKNKDFVMEYIREKYL